ncbi:MAG: TonB-dependent receptor, partial [Acidobacteria bacterium]|nr:TonB-dependent receptor [Acidobacteriota bacterium]
MKPPRILVTVIWVACALAAAAPAWTQETTSGSLDGRVIDAQNLAVPGAAVTVSSAQGARTYVTDATGHFFAPYLTPGTYTVRVELQGFRPAE